GRVYIKAVPDADGFRRDLENKLRAIEESLKVTIPVDFDVDTAGLRTQLEALERSKITIPVDFGDGSEIERLRARIEALDNAQVTIPVGLGDGTEIERMRQRVESLDGQKIRLSVSLRNATKVIAQLEAVDAAVSKLNGRAIHIKIDADGAAAVITQLAGVTAATVGAQTATKTFGAASAGTYAGLTGQVGQFATMLAQAGAMSLGLSIAGAGVTAAWGAAATAVAAFPAAIALAGVPMALLLADTDELKKRIGELSPAFQQLRKDIAGALAEGIAPALQTLANQVLPGVRDNVLGVATTMGQLVQETANWLATEPGINALNAVFGNVNRTLNEMKPGLAAIGQAFLEMAGQSAAFDALTQ